MKPYFSIVILSLLILRSYQSNASGKPGKDYSGSLAGRVIEKASGRSIPGATVYINDLKLAAVTDTSGHYSFRNLPSGTFLVEARSIGFNAVIVNVTINGAVEENFVLSENVIEESEVVVTGLSKATQIRRSPIPIVSVSHAYMATNINTNIIDAITKVPGVTAVTTGPNVSKPYIRGLGFNRILTLYDGVRQEGQQWGDEHGIEVDQYSIDRIEVVKGPASLSYGSDAVAGVVNLIPTQPAAEGKIIGDILGEYHTNNRMIAVSGMLGGTHNGFEWMGRLSHKQATNYQNEIDGRVYGTGFKETDVTSYLGLHKKWGYSHLSFSMFNDLQEIPDGSRDSATGKFTKQITEDDLSRPIVSDAELRSYTIADVHQHIRHYRVYNNNSFSLGKEGRIVINLAYQNSRRQEFSHPEFKMTPGLQLDLNTFNYDIKYYLPETRGWNFTFGVNGMYQKNDVTKGTEFIIPSYNLFDIGPFALLKKTISKIDVSGGVRWDSRSFANKELYTLPDPVTGFDRPVYGGDTVGADLQFNKYSHVFSGMSGSLGFTYNATDKLSFKANIARGFRAPNISEIAANGVHPGTNIYQIGNPNFKPEANWQGDIGFSYASKYVMVNMSVFSNRIQNYIFNQRLLNAVGDDSVIVTGNQTYKFQQGKAVLYGGEMNVDFHPAKNLHFENSISLVYGNNKAIGSIKLNPGAKYLLFIPPFHGLSELRYDINSKQNHFANGYVKAQLVYYAAQNRVYSADNTETKTAGYTLFNLGAGTGFTNKNGRTVVILSVIANNLFDVAYFNHLSRLKYFLYSDTDTDPGHGIHEMGRNVAIKLEFPLSFSSK
jgi:iron complex outermembrane receptor protein